MSNTSRSIIRSVSSIVVAAVVYLLARVGLGAFSGTAAAYVPLLVAAGYAAGVRLLEKKWPAAGWLLGVPGAPAYTPPAPKLLIPTVTPETPTPADPAPKA